MLRKGAERTLPVPRRYVVGRTYVVWAPADTEHRRAKLRVMVQAAGPGWVIVRAGVEQERPRLLKARPGRSDYTDRDFEAMPDEPEAVDESWHRHVARVVKQITAHPPLDRRPWQ